MENFDAANAIQDLQYFGEFGGVNPSISDSSTYTFLSAKTMFDTFEGNAEGCYLYSRHSSPMNLYLAQALAKMEVTEAANVTASGMGGFNSMMALSTRNDDYKTASRPFDKDRDGFVLGEGAGCIILEEYEHAKKRGATIYAELAGGGLSADAYHMTAPHPEGLGAYLVMKNCLEDAGLTPDEVDHINMHGTSTPLGDIAESNAIARLLGEHAYDIQINSTKSMTGHLLGAAGVIEAIAALGTILHGIVPPTINHFTDDENIDSRLDFTFNHAVKKDVKIALNLLYRLGPNFLFRFFTHYGNSSSNKINTIV